MLFSTLRVSCPALVALLFAAVPVSAQDPTTEIKWGEAPYGLRLGLPIEVVANTNYPTAAEAVQPLLIKVHNPSDATQFYVNAGRFAGFDFHFLTPDGQKPLLPNDRSGTPALVELAPGETKTIEVEVPSRELKHFELPLVASIELYDKAQQTRYRVFSPPMKLIVAD